MGRRQRRRGFANLVIINRWSKTSGLGVGVTRSLCIDARKEISFASKRLPLDSDANLFGVRIFLENKFTIEISSLLQNVRSMVCNDAKSFHGI